MGRGDRHKVRYAHERERKKKLREARKAREREAASKSGR